MKVCYMQMTYQMQSKYKRAVHHSSKIDLVRPYLETESSFLRRVRFATNENGICINMQPFAFQNTGHLLGGDAVSAADDGEDDVARLDALEDGDGLGVWQTHQRLAIHCQDLVTWSEKNANFTLRTLTLLQDDGEALPVKDGTLNLYWNIWLPHWRLIVVLVAVALIVATVAIVVEEVALIVAIVAIVVVAVA